MFWKKKSELSSLTKLTELIIEVNVLKSQVKNLELDFETLRNFVKEKIRKTYKQDAETTEDINNSVLLPDNGFNKFNKKGGF